MTTKTGTLYGIGVGPGDPELITLKALKVLQAVPHIFASCSTKNTYSLALSIVRCHLNGAGIEHLPFPMTKDPQVLASAWEQNARRVLEVLATGSDAAFVTLGDPLTYSTFGYLLKTLKRLAPRGGHRHDPGHHLLQCRRGPDPHPADRRGGILLPGVRGPGRGQAEGSY